MEREAGRDGTTGRKSKRERVCPCRREERELAGTGSSQGPGLPSPGPRPGRAEISCGEETPALSRRTSPEPAPLLPDRPCTLGREKEPDVLQR